MSNETFQPAQDRIWKQYEFIFQNTRPVDEALSASIREKIAALQLQKEPLNIRYEKVEEEPLKVDIFIEEKVDRYFITGLLTPREERIFHRSDKPANMQAYTSIETNAGTDISMIPVAANRLDLAAPGVTDDEDVESITFRGAVRTPPSPSQPLP